jgi:arginyl-tRNA--protein-N-Asp/Glu arginylyltransferase
VTHANIVAKTIRGVCALSIERRNFPQFFITAPAPCPYLAGMLERKVFTHLIGQDAGALNDTLSQGGFRRSQNIAYRPACDGCGACVSVRVPANLFNWSKSFRRIWAANADLQARIVPAKATSEQYSLFRSYIDARHFEGGMADMTILDFAAMVDESFVDTRIAEYRLKANKGSGQGELLAAALFDLLDDGLSLIYSFFNPESHGRSLGTYVILDSIRRAQQMGLSYVYLGYWVKGSNKMAYKARFLPQERLMRDGWVRFDK